MCLPIKHVIHEKGRSSWPPFGWSMESRPVARAVRRSRNRAWRVVAPPRLWLLFVRGGVLFAWFYLYLNGVRAGVLSVLYG